MIESEGSAFVCRQHVRMNSGCPKWQAFRGLVWTAESGERVGDLRERIRLVIGNIECQ